MTRTEYDRYAALWTTGNNAGNGYALADEDVEEAAEFLAGPDGVLHTPANTDEIAIVRTETGAIVGIGDSHGAWAVELEPAPAIVVGSVTREHGDEPEDRDEMSAYVAVDVTIGGEAYSVGTMVGVRPSNQGSARASGCYASGAYLATWSDERGDRDSLPAWSREPVAAALYGARRRLWAEVEALRA